MTYEPNEFEKVGEDIERMKIRCAELCKRGYRMSVMLAVEDIIKENNLDRFGVRLEAAE